MRSRFLSLAEMDAPTSFFFNLESRVAQQRQMPCLKLPDGRVTSNVLEMRNHAVDFYSNLYAAESCDNDCMTQLFQGLPQLDCDSKIALDANITFKEVTAAVGNLNIGRSPGMDGLPADFYKGFWSCLGKDLFDVFCECIKDGVLPTSCQHAVLSLLPKKGDLALLKNWRPVALLTTEYKIFSKCLSNRLKHYLELIVHKDQSYCVPKRSIMDNLFLIRDVLDICKVFNMNVGLVSLDQEKAFDRVDHDYLFNVLKVFGVGDKFVKLIQLLYTDAACMVKVGGGLSRPFPILRGIRQGCPLSGQLYSLAIEPLLFKLREKLSGFYVSGFSFVSKICLSAYADDITVFVNHNEDIKRLFEVLNCYEKSSSAKVNWNKSEAFWVGRGSVKISHNCHGTLGGVEKDLNCWGFFWGRIISKS